MALTKVAFRLSETASGKDMLLFKDGSSRHAQGVALVDGAGEHIGLEDAPIHVASIDFAHFELHEGDSFYYHDLISLGNSAAQDYLLTVADLAHWPHFSYSVESLYGITVELYEGADRTGTTAQTAYNRNRNSANTPGLTIHKGHSGGTTDGTRILWRRSGSGASAGKLSGTSRDATERILKQNTRYILRITSAAASNEISVELDWYEHAFS